MKRAFLTVLAMVLVLGVFLALPKVNAQTSEELLTLTWSQGTYYDKEINPNLVSRKYTVVSCSEGEVIRFEFPSADWGVYGYYADENGSWGYNTYTSAKDVLEFEVKEIGGRMPTELRLTVFHRSGSNVTITDALWSTFDVKIYKSVKQTSTEPTQSTTEPSEIPGVDTKLTVATQNYGLWNNGVTEYVEDSKVATVSAAWRQMLADHDADIIGGQEYMTYFDRSQTISPKEIIFGEMYDYQFVTGNKYTGKNIVSKTKLYDETVLTFSNGTGRQYVKAYTYIDGKKICILNAHLSFDTYAHRKAEIDELISVMDKERYVIALGDFNVETPEEFQLFEAAGYRVANAGAFGNFTTWPNFGSTAAGNRVLDNIVVNSNIEILDVTCDNRNLSDHAMLVAQLNLKATSGGEEVEPDPDEPFTPPEKCPHCNQAVTWTDWSGSHFTSADKSGKHYRLTSNISPTGQIYVGGADAANPIEMDVVIDLNGYKLESTSRAFRLQNGATLSLVNMGNRVAKVGAAYTNSPGGVINADGDSSLDLYAGVKLYSLAESSFTYGKIVALKGGKLTMYGGTVVGSPTKNDGGAVYLDGADFTMKGGDILGSTVTGGEGGAVYMTSGNFLMQGGTISGGQATNGGAVYVTNSTFTMEDGTISGGKALYGGALHLHMTDFAMTGGTIRDGKAMTSDSGIPRGGNVFMNQTSKKSVVISGGEILDGKAQNGNGGNVYCDNATVLNITGDVVISGGEASRVIADSNGGGNVYMFNGTKLILSGGTIKDGVCTTSYGGNLFSRANVEMTGGTISGGTAVNGGNVFVSGHESLKTFDFSGGVIKNGTATVGTIDGTAAKGVYNGDNVYVNAATMNIGGGSIIDDNGGNAILAFTMTNNRTATVNLTLTGKGATAAALDGKVYAIQGAVLTADIGEVETDTDGDQIWYRGEVEAVIGDYTGDGEVTNEDVIHLLWYTVFPEDYPITGKADFTGDGEVTNEDVIHLLWYTVFPEDYPLQ